MPIDSNGSSLKVITNFGGKVVDQEDPVVRRELYDRNQQIGGTVQRRGYTMQPPAEQKSKPKDSTTDLQVKKAVDKDLRKRNIKP